MSHGFSKEASRCRIEAFCDVGVQDIFGFLANGRENRCNRIVAGAPGAKAIAVGCEARLPCRFQRAFDEGGAGSIGHGRHAQWSLIRRAWLRDPDAADRGVPSRVRDCAKARRWGGVKDLTPCTSSEADSGKHLWHDVVVTADIMPMKGASPWPPPYHRLPVPCVRY